MMLQFTVPGEPVGKGRPRFVRATGIAYTPEKTAQYEDYVRQAYGVSCGARGFEKGEQRALRVVAYFGVPKSANQRDRSCMLAGVIRPAKKPDADNLLKVIADALNGVAYHDDAQIVYIEVEKRYDVAPRVEVTIWALRDGVIDGPGHDRALKCDDIMKRYGLTNDQAKSFLEEFGRQVGSVRAIQESQAEALYREGAMTPWLYRQNKSSKTK